MRSKYFVISCIFLLFSSIINNYSTDDTGLDKFEFKIYAQENNDNSSIELQNGTDILIDNASGFMAGNGTRLLMNESLTVMENGTISDEENNIM